MASPATILVTGARGQLGLRCIEYWLQAGATVKALARDAGNQPAQPGLQWITGDLMDAKFIDKMPDPFPEMVIFTAPLWLLPPLLPALIHRGVTRIIAFSSTSVHTKLNSGNAYEREIVGKLRASEEALFTSGKQGGVAITILRPTLIYGVGMDKNITSIARVMQKFSAFPVPLRATGLRQPVHADDLALATVQVANSAATYGKAYDVGGAERLTYRAFLCRIAQELKKNIVFVPVPAFAPLLDIVGRCLGRSDHLNGEIVRRMGRDMVFDHQAAQHDFGWNPRPFLDRARQPGNVPFF